MGKLVSSAHPFTLADQWLLYEFISATRRRDIENLRWEKGAVLEDNLRPNLDEVRAWLPIKYLVTVLKVLTHSTTERTAVLPQVLQPRRRVHGR